MLQSILAEGDASRLVSLLIEYGHPVARALTHQVKMATGSRVLGYHSIDMTLRFPIRACTNLPWRVEAEIPDVPRYAQLLEIAIWMGTSPDSAIDRLAYWMWIATQIAWFHHPVMMMNHHHAVWREYSHPCILRHRDDVDY